MNICLIIGHPIKHSRSPSIHNVGYKVLGIDDQFIYIRADIKPQNLKMAIDGVRVLGVRGVSVTIPHKQAVMKYLDRIDKTAKKIGAVNTIVNEKGKLIGYNTDWIGGITPLKEALASKGEAFRGKNVALLGAGGAARAITYGLKKEGAHILVFNRTIEHAKALVKQFDLTSAHPLTAENYIRDVNIIINTTSVGMKPHTNASPISASCIRPEHIVYDIVYTPKETRLLRDAKEKGAKVVYGYEMLLYQGVAQFELYTGYKAPVKAMRNALERALEGKN